MKTLRNISEFSSHPAGAVAAIGNFDGVHLGHQSILSQAAEIARQNQQELGVLTFEPHPRAFFAREGAPPFRLMQPSGRGLRLAKCGVDVLFEHPFDDAVASLSPIEFAQQVIVDRLRLSHVIIGADFRFGKNREGTAALLSNLGRDMGFGVTIADLLANGGAPVSSTKIREALSQGEPGQAAEMLGHWHHIQGPVLHGEKRGRELGYPTANLSIDGLHPPKLGVYAVLVDVLSGPHTGRYQGAASIGVRPMFGENRANCETYIFDFAGDLYGTEISVALVEYLRGEEKFDSLDALCDQMALDCATARDVLADL